jgi:hypothetical protein
MVGDAGLEYERAQVKNTVKSRFYESRFYDKSQFYDIFAADQFFTK